MLPPLSIAEHFIRPSSAKFLIEETVRRLVVLRHELVGVELETMAETLRGNGEVEHRRAAETVLFVEREFLAVADAVHEVGLLGRRLGKLLEDCRRIHTLAVGVKKPEVLLLSVAFIRPAAVDLLAVEFAEGPERNAVRTAEEWLVLERFVAVENNFRAVRIRKSNAVEAADGLGVLFRADVINLDGACLILAEKILHKIEIMLSHIAEAACVIIPISAERTMRAVLVVGLPRRRAEPHIPVECLGADFRREVNLTRPVELPAKTLTGAEDALDGALAQNPVFNYLADGLYRRAHAVEAARETEPRVKAEHSALSLDVFHDALAFAHCAGHRLFAPDILACAGRHDRLHAVPMRRSADMDDIDGRIFKKLGEIGIRLDITPAFLLGRFKTLSYVKLIRIAKTDKARALVRKMVVALRDATETYQRTRKLVGRSGRSPQNLGRNKVERTNRCGALDERPS